MGAVDGPGLRCVVFMQGCPLRCIYCHNPDTHSFDGGEEATPEQMLSKILRFKEYIQSGGVTVSGGEPMCQSEFVKELFILLKENGIHTALDTSGNCNISEAAQVLRYTDLVLLDVKFLTDADYEKYCGGSFSKTEEFLSLCEKMSVPVWIRQVIVPSINDNEESIKKLNEFMYGFTNIQKAELLPFRKLCEAKYENLGIEFKLKDTPEMSKEKCERLKEFLDEKYR